MGASEAKEDFNNDQDHGKEDSEAPQEVTLGCSDQEGKKSMEDIILVQELEALMRGEIEGDKIQGMVKTTMSMNMGRPEMIMTIATMVTRKVMMKEVEVREILLKEVYHSKEVEEVKCSMGKATRVARIQIDLDN